MRNLAMKRALCGVCSSFEANISKMRCVENETSVDSVVREYKQCFSLKSSRVCGMRFGEILRFSEMSVLEID